MASELDDLRFCEMQDSRSRAESGSLPIGAIKSKQHGILLLLLPAFKFSRRLLDVPHRTREADEAEVPCTRIANYYIRDPAPRPGISALLILHFSSYAK